VVSIILPVADHRHFHDRHSDFDHSRLNRFQPATSPEWLARFAGLAVVIYRGGDPADNSRRGSDGLSD
jgi:hypothetical protein